jgi:hypothetical protein
MFKKVLKNWYCACAERPAHSTHVLHIVIFIRIISKEDKGNILNLVKNVGTSVSCD